jgi:hypothetical protein
MKLTLTPTCRVTTQVLQTQLFKHHGRYLHNFNKIKSSRLIFGGSEFVSNHKPQLRSQRNEHVQWFVVGTLESRSKSGTNTPAIQKECSVIPCLFVAQKFGVIIPATDLIWTDFQGAVKLDSRTTLATPRRPEIATPRTWRLHYRLIQRIGGLTWRILSKLHLGPDLLPRITSPTESLAGNREKMQTTGFYVPPSWIRRKLWPSDESRWNYGTKTCVPPVTASCLKTQHTGLTL